MFLVFDQEACELRRKDHVVGRIIFLGAVNHFVLLAAMNIDTFHVKPALLLGRKRGNQQDLFVCPSIKRVAKRWINHRQEKKVVWTSDFPFAEHF